MNTESESQLPDPMELMTDQHRLECVFSNERTERHLMPKDHPPIPHSADEQCWCQPELVYKSVRWGVWRHKRQQ